MSPRPTLRFLCDGFLQLWPVWLCLRLPVYRPFCADDEGDDDHGQGHADEAHRAAPHHVVRGPSWVLMMSPPSYRSLASRSRGSFVLEIPLCVFLFFRWQLKHFALA